jgi:transcriptional regulator with XRE-family HTH domain
LPHVCWPPVWLYERGKHLPDPATLERLGKVLNRPLPYFYAADDVLAALIVAVDAATPSQRRRLMALLGIK